MIKAVIFDLDGTLLNTIDDLKNSVNYALKKFNFPERSLPEIKSFVGDGVKKLIERAVPPETDVKTIENCLEIFKENYSLNMYNLTCPFNGILEILMEIKQDGLKIAVVSNKFDSAVKNLCKKYFPNFVDIAIGQSEIISPKPMPDGVLKVIDELKISKENVIYIGDSDVDVKTAKNANLKCIGVTWGYRDKSFLDGADFIINQPCDIIKIIRSL